MTSARALLAASIAAALVSSTVLASSPSFSLVGVGDFASPSLDPNQGSISSKFGPGGGILLGIPLSYHVGLELGGLYMTRKFDETDENLTVQQNAIQVPALLRLRFNRFISFGAGGYYAKTIGNVDTTSDVGGAPSTVAGLKSNDYGLLGSLAFRIPMGYTVDLLLDGRYAYGMTNLVDNAALAGINSEKTRDAQFIVGFTFHGMTGRY